jgi:hypothetical protein
MLAGVLWSNEVDAYSLEGAEEPIFSQEISELREILSGIIELQEHSLTANHGLTANIDYGQNFEYVRLFRDLLVEARAVQMDNSNRMKEMPARVISSISAPVGVDNVFRVRFVSEEYFHLADMLLEFAGIPEYMLELEVMEIPHLYIPEPEVLCIFELLVYYGWTDQDSVDFWVNKFLFEQESMDIYEVQARLEANDLTFPDFESLYQ